ncbi:hypothetical protein V1523DRAFT_422443 [Lipomyces doorenjongii]
MLSWQHFLRDRCLILNTFLSFLYLACAESYASRRSSMAASSLVELAVHMDIELQEQYLVVPSPADLVTSAGGAAASTPSPRHPSPPNTNCC